MIRAPFVVDASGPGGFLARTLGIRARARPARFSTRLLFAHFDGVPPFSEVEPALPAAGSAGEPFPEHWAAVHHLLDSGWMYQLRFDDGVTSAGFVVDLERLDRLGLELPWGEPARAFGALLARHPSLDRQFGPARPLAEIRARFVREANHSNLRMMYDTFHANIEEKDIARAIRDCAAETVHVHISENDRSTPGEGHVDWDTTFRTLKEVKYDGWLVVEAFGRSDGVGHQLNIAFQLFDVPMILSYALAFIIVVQIIEMGILQPLIARANKWRR